MHNTVNLLTGKVQTMSFPANSTELDKKGVSLAGKPKGMEQVLKE